MDDNPWRLGIVALHTRRPPFDWQRQAPELWEKEVWSPGSKTRPRIDRSDAIA